MADIDWLDWLDWLAECEPVDSEDPDHYLDLLRDEDML